MNEIIPILSLIPAILAVFLGPFISWKIAKRQISSSFKVANKQIVAPMRQTWINNLRDLIAEISSISLHYFQAGFEDRKDSEYKRLTLLEGKISLMLNFQEDDHKELHNLIRAMLNLLEKGNDGDSTFFQIHPKIMSLSRHILKRMESGKG
jgi:hypothetical protein